ncbi:uncharacterized protein [Leuresthes tenuis]|uniref:uncharacterized protein n=1 Tax=Leuresthes tenuis TaxID=355514 RepID=UPI003B5075BD
MTTREDLWKILQNLTNEEFKQFKWFLKDGGTEDGFSAIPVARLEGADRQDTVDLMVQNYGCPGAVHKSSGILVKIYRNDLSQHLLNDLELRDLKNIDSSCLKSQSDSEKAKLGQVKAEIRLLIQERRMMISQIQRSAEVSRKSSDRQTADCVAVFTVLAESIQRSLADVIEQIEEKQRTTQKQAEGLIQELEQDISELTKRAAEVDHLPLTEDDLYPLQNFPCAPKNLTEERISLPSYGTIVMTQVKELQKKIDKEMENLLNKAKLNRVQQFAKDVTLDPGTAHPNLVLSDDGKQVHCGSEEQHLPDNPERFNSAVNVLGKPSFSSGRFYFEVQVRGKSAWDLGVVKESISRKGSIKSSPESGHWTICLREGGKYRASAVCLNVKAPLNKVGVFVDYEGGSVLFYNVDSAEPIHSFRKCSFTEKLYPFFSPSVSHAGLNSAPLVISPVSYTDRDENVCSCLDMFKGNGLEERSQQHKPLKPEERVNLVSFLSVTFFLSILSLGYIPLLRDLRCFPGPVLDLEANSFGNETDDAATNKDELERVQQSAVDVTLDPDTAHPDLVLSRDGKQVYDSDVTKDLPDSPKRFNKCASVLGKEKFSSGIFYYEVLVKEKTAWTVGVVRESIDRKGHINMSPDKGFWTIWLRNKVYEAIDDPSVRLPLKSRLQKVGVTPTVAEKENVVSFLSVNNSEPEGDVLEEEEQRLHHLEGVMKEEEEILTFRKTGSYSESRKTPKTCNHGKPKVKLKLNDNIARTDRDNMAKLSLELWNILQELEQDDFQKFKWRLKQNYVLEGNTGIPPAELEGAERWKTVDLMIGRYKSPGAKQITMNILKEIRQNGLVDRLRNYQEPEELEANSFGNETDDAATNKDELERVQQSAVDVTLDPDTAHPDLVLSRDGKQVYDSDVTKDLPDSPKRFNKCASVLGKEKFSSGIFYYEVLVKEKTAWTVGVVRESINRKGHINMSPDKGFWTIWLRNKVYEAIDDPSVRLPLKSRLQKVGVCVNYPDALVSFYNVDTADLLYSFSDCRFSGNLLPYFHPYINQNGTNSAPLIICPVINKKNIAKLRRVQQCAVDVTLDPDTAHPDLVLSSDGKRVHHGDVTQDLPDSPDRFNDCCSVLGRESFLRNFYYEVQVEGKTDWSVGVSTESVFRKGSITLKPENGFWTISLRSGDEYEASDTPVVCLTLRAHPQKLGVFVDYWKGLVSFYDVDTADLLYSFTGCYFAERLLPYFCPCTNVGGLNSAPLVISTVRQYDETGQ